MIKVDNIEVFNFDGALRGMRNPLDSHNNSDSRFITNPLTYEKAFNIGDNDLLLAQRLIQSGTDHSKFMRQIFVSFDLTAPLYFWKEFDTYRVATVSNSESTMHTIHKKPFTQDMVSCEHLDKDSLDVLDIVIDKLNIYRNRYISDKDKNDWWNMIQLLPSSFNQKRTITLNYQVLRNMYFARRNHKLDEWRDFCKMIENLPYGKELICLERESSNA